MQKLSHVWLADAVPVHEGVFAQSGEGENRVKRVLLGSEKVNANCEGEDELRKDDEQG